MKKEKKEMLRKNEQVKYRSRLEKSLETKIESESLIETFTYRGSPWNKQTNKKVQDQVENDVYSYKRMDKKDIRRNKWALTESLTKCVVGVGRKSLVRSFPSEKSEKMQNEKIQLRPVTGLKVASDINYWNNYLTTLLSS